MSSVSPNSHCEFSKFDHRETFCLSNASFGRLETTHPRGKLLGAVRPQWTKVTESEQRIAWLRKMIDRNLVVRDLESYAKNIRDKLRSEKCKVREEERVILMGIMKLKLKDEIKNLIELKRGKEEKRMWLIEQIGKGGRLDRIMTRLHRDMIKLKTKLKKKYKAKLEHLEAERQRELEEKKKLLIIPNGRIHC